MSSNTDGILLRKISRDGNASAVFSQILAFMKDINDEMAELKVKNAELAGSLSSSRSMSTKDRIILQQITGDDNNMDRDVPSTQISVFMKNISEKVDKLECIKNDIVEMKVNTAEQLAAMREVFNKIK